MSCIEIFLWTHSYFVPLIESDENKSSLEIIFTRVWTAVKGKIK